MDQTELNKTIALKWIAAFNEQNPDKLLDLYDEDAVHFSPKLKIRQPKTQGMIHGKPQLRSWWEDAFKRLPGLQYKLKNLIVDEGQILIEYLRVCVGEPDMMIAEILEIRNNLIAASRVYHG